jgi:hypothetical protein
VDFCSNLSSAHSRDTLHLVVFHQFSGNGDVPLVVGKDRKTEAKYPPKADSHTGRGEQYRPCQHNDHYGRFNREAHTIHGCSLGRMLLRLILALLVAAKGLGP